MYMKFWGVRGSIPGGGLGMDMAPKYKKIIQDFKKYENDTQGTVDEFLEQLPAEVLLPVGYNTPCVEIKSGEDRVILDAGSGLRGLGLEMLPLKSAQESYISQALDGIKPASTPNDAALDGDPSEYTILFSHTHWDHIQGFPFFYPAYLPSTRLRLYHQNSRKLEKILNFQQTAPQLFPIGLDKMGAEISFHNFPKRGIQVGNIEIKALTLPHPGGSLAFRLTAEGKSIVYATDYELYPENEKRVKSFHDFIDGADVLISDSHFTYLESITKQGWGHSTAFSGVSLAMEADVKSIYLFHHNHEYSDEILLDNLEKARAYYAMMNSKGNMGIHLAKEGLTLEI